MCSPLLDTVIGSGVGMEPTLIQSGDFQDSCEESGDRRILFFLELAAWRYEAWTRSGHFSTKRKASQGWSQHKEQGLAKEIPETLDEANPEARPTIGFPVRRVNEFHSCLNQYELGFLLYVAQNILNDKADFLII